MIKKIILFIFLLSFPVCFQTQCAFAQPFDLRRAALNIEEDDTTPSVWPYKLIVTGGTLTDNGDGTASLTTGGGGGSGDVTSVGDCATGACFTGTSGNTLTLKGATSGTTAFKPSAVAGTTTITLPAETGTVCTTGSICSGYQAGALTGDVTTSGAAATIAADSVALTTDTTGNYAAGDAEAGAALSGDSATAFFSIGTLEDARLPSSMADKTITGSLAVPQGANPTVDAAGEIAVDTSSGAGSGIRFYGDAAYTIPGWHQKTMIINSPTASGDGAVFKTPVAITIKTVNVLCVGGTNWVGHVDEFDANGATAAAVDSSDITATAGTNAADDGALSNPSIDANDWVGLHTTSVSGTPTRVLITISYTVDQVN